MGLADAHIGMMTYHGIVMADANVDSGERYWHNERTDVKT